MSSPLEANHLIRYLWNARRPLMPGLLLGLARSAVVAPCPLLFQRMIDVELKERDAIGLAQTAGIFLLLTGLHWIFSIWGSRALAKALARLMADLRSRIFYKLQFLSMGYLDQQKTGRLLSKYAFDTQRVEGLLSQVLNQFLPNVLYGGTIAIILVVLNWRMALVLAMALPIYAVAKWRFFGRLQHSNREAHEAQEKMTGTASEIISALRLVRSFGEEQQAERQLGATSEAFARSRVQQAGVSAVFGTFVYVSVQVLSLVVVAGGTWLAMRDQMTLGTLLAFTAGLPVVLGPIHLFIGLSEQFFVGQQSYASIKELIDSTYVESWRGTARPEVRGGLRFEGVSFRYPGHERMVIRDFNLEVRPGEHVAFVGPSGSGKSTLASLLLGLYQPTAGVILIDGHRQEELDMRWMRRRMAVVLQESILLSGSVADNIRFARASATDAEVREAARLANAEEFIVRLPQGADTIVGERGVLLSGGQRQRIAIARAILRNPPILILDEATSALDYESERLIQEALARLAVGRTVITIAHRLSTVRNADRIVVLREGVAIEQGTFAELMARGGYFRQLVSARGEIEGGLV